MSNKDKIRYSAIVDHTGKAYIGVNLEESNNFNHFNGDSTDPKIEEGVWTDSKNRIIKKAKLGDTVYFHVGTENIDEGEEITLRLYEYDYNFFMDWIDPDDGKFNKEKIEKKARVYNNKATIELVLNENWEGMIKDDSNNAFSLDTNLELYWKVKYNKISEVLPTKEKNYLSVSFSDKTLYFKTPTFEHNLPEFISYEGDPMFLMEFILDKVKGKIQDKGVEIIENVAGNKTKKIAFTKLKKGFLVDNNGKVYTGRRLINEYKKIYSNSGELFENVQKGKNFGYVRNGKHITIKGISQLDYFMKNGTRVQLLGLIKNTSKILDIFDITKFFMNGLDTSKPLSIPAIGPLAPLALILDLAGILVLQQKAEMDIWLEEVVQQEIDIAKLNGLEATRKAINSWNHNQEYNWQLLAISKETANKLIAGEFRTFDSLYELESNLEFTDNSKIEVLYREVLNENRDEYIYVIETIFINE